MSDNAGTVLGTDWTTGPAKWAAGGVLAGASLVGLVWVLTARVPAPIFSTSAGPVTIVRAAPGAGHDASPSAGARPTTDLVQSPAPIQDDSRDRPAPTPAFDPRSLALTAAPEAGASTLAPYVEQQRPRVVEPSPAPVRTPTPATRRSPAPSVVRDTEPAPEPEATPAPQTQPSIATRIHVNTATAEQLDLLPGVGPVIAQRIIDERTANGPFRDLGDLQRVRGIGPKTAAKMGEHVRFD